MRKIMAIATTFALLASAGCGRSATENRQADPTAGEDVVTVPDESNAGDADLADWVGKWTGPEGMFVDITQTGEGKFRLEMQSDLEMRGSYEGVAAADGIRFNRGPETLTLKKSDGDATGMKWLAGKKDCLMVKPGEGYCRD